MAHQKGAPKTGGRCKGTPNKATTERQAQVAASGKTPLEVMLDNMRRAYNEAHRLMAVLCGPDAPQGEEAQALMEEMWKFRDAAQRYAVAAAPYVHPRLAAVSHQHRGADGSIVRPILVIEGYPAADLDRSLKAIPAPEEVDGGGDNNH
jgi:hypothetical protein